MTYVNQNLSNPHAVNQLTALKKQLSLTDSELTSLGILPTMVYNKPAISFNFQNEKSEYIDYVVNRIHNDFVFNNHKYINPQATTIPYYLNAANVFKTENKGNVFFIEGIKKAISLCKNGIFAVGANGIHGIISNTIKSEKPNSFGKYETIGYAPKPKFNEFCENYDFKNALFFIDNDFNKHKKDSFKKRISTFLSAVLAFKSVSNQKNKVPYLVYLTDKCKAKSFDDITNPFVKSMVINGLNSLNSNEFVTIIRLNDISENLIKYIVSGKFNFSQHYCNTQYLGQDTNIKEVVYNAIASRDNLNDLLIRAATGKGKTNLIIDIIKNFIFDSVLNPVHRKIVLVFPTNSLVESLAKDIKNDSDLYSIIVNMNMSKDEHAYLSIALKTCNIIITTYASYHRVSKTLEINDLAFFDEFHTAQISHAAKNDNFLTAYDTTTCKKIHVSATPIYEFCYAKNIDILFISDREIAPKKKVNLYQYENKRDVLYSYLAAESKSAKNTDIIILFVNSKEIINELANDFENEFDIQYWYSAEIVKNSEYYKEFLEKGSFVKSQNDKPLLILATSFIYEGVSFKNENVKSIAIFGETSPLQTLQALARMRKYDKNTQFNVFLSDKTVLETKKQFDFLRVYEVAKNHRLLNEREVDPELKKDFITLGKLGYNFNYYTNNNFLSWNLVCGEYSQKYDYMEMLSIECDITQKGSFLVDTIAPPKEKKDNTEIDNAAKELLESSVYKAANLVYTISKNEKLRLALKAKYQCSYDILYRENIEYNKSLCKTLALYFEMYFKLNDLNFKIVDTNLIWEHLTDRYIDKVVHSLQVFRMVDMVNENKAFKNDSTQYENMLQINFIKNECQKYIDTSVIQNEFIDKIHNLMLNHFTEIKELNFVGLGTKPKYTSQVIKSLFSFTKNGYIGKSACYCFEVIDSENYYQNIGIAKKE